MMGPETPLAQVRGVGPARLRELERAGYRSVADLVRHLPFRYEDRRTLSRITELAGPGSCTLEGRLRGVRTVRPRRGLTIVQARLEDGADSLPVVWFNRPYLARQLVAERPYLLSGELRARTDGGWQLLNPSVEDRERAIHGLRIVPVYGAVGSLGPAFVRRLMAEILAQVDLETGWQEPLPPSLRERYDLPPLGRALAILHRPGVDQDPELLNRRRSPAHLRLIYGELLELELALAHERSRQVSRPKLHGYRLDRRLGRRLLELLPFRLTRGQHRVLREIAVDLAGRRPMMRLLQGEVGSGKTVVAALALSAALESGLQAALMAPTELLAEQHVRSLRRLLGERYPVLPVTASSVDGATTRRRLAAGEPVLAVGTHALIGESLRFARLGLVVIDEQHRFGVAQRRLLQRKGDRPDVLVMTATPIPRSLALAVYGDLDLSLLDELPPGRRPVETRVVEERRRRGVYDWLRGELAGGAQAYVVFPRIDEGDGAASSIADLGERLRRYLGALPSAVLHGRTPPGEREVLMAAFAAGELKVLVSTTLIEVGVDVARATVMVIESAERFGLAQLHQLRGRVGRGAQPGRCVAIHGRLTPEGRRRLEVFAETCDGFRIAEADLEIRGPGELLGVRQAGLPRLEAANLLADREWLERARDDARGVVAAAATRPELAALVARVARRHAERAPLLAGG